MDYQDHRLHEIGALRWALRRLSLPEYRYCSRKSDEDAKDQVLESKKIEQLVITTRKESNCLSFSVCSSQATTESG